MKYKSYVLAAAFALTLVVLLSLLMGSEGPPSSVRADTFASPLAINEVDYDQPGTDAAEFVELLNSSGGSVNLDAYSLVLVNGTGGGAAVYDTIDLPNVDLAAGDYYVVCANAATVANCDLDADTDTNFIQNGSPDAVALTLDQALIDTVSYEGDTGAPYTEGSGVGLEDSGGEADVGLSRCPDGTDTDQNNADLVATDISPGATNLCPKGNLVINEVDYDQPGTDAAEFVELMNNGKASLNLDLYSLVLVNGADTSVYDIIDLPNVDLAAGDYYVVCANAATVANCDLDVSPDTNLIQNGAPDAVALTLEQEVIDTVSYEGDTGAPYTEGSGVGLEDNGIGADMGLSRCPDGTDTDQNNIDLSLQSGTPGAANQCEQCGDPATFIHEIQGSGPSTPMPGATGIVIEGVVVGDFQDTTNQLGGFFVQEEDADADADPQTSEGLFVYDGGFGIDVAPGDVVRVRGTVAEYSDVTELTNVSAVQVCSSGASVTTGPIDLPVSAIVDLERYEGMLVTFPETLYATEHYNLGRYGELWLSVENRLWNPTSVVTPGAPALALQDLNDRSRVLIDDGSNIQNPAVVPYLAIDNTLRLGDTVQNLTGVLSYGFGYYRLHPTIPPAFVRANDRTATPVDPGDTFTVAGMNVLNYFNGDGLGGGFPTTRGASTLSEFNRQRDKIIAAILAMDADVLGLTELENDGYGPNSAIQDLVNGLNAVAGAGTYAFIDPGVTNIGTDEITVGFVYRTATATPVGAAAILDSSVDPLFLDTKNRPSLAQTFEASASGERLTIAVNHLKSKGSDCNDVGDPDTGDGQGNCNLTRTNAAIALANWLATDPTGSGDLDSLIVGDLNAYAMEDPIEALKSAGYTDLVSTTMGVGAYSYVFDGQSGYLDHALGNASLGPQVVGMTIWHINADEPRVLDYNEEYNPAYLYSPDAYRSADHDPVLVHLRPPLRIYLPVVMRDPAP
jgi:predicted extracellular nuclease